MAKQISQQQLIDAFKDDDTYMHLAKTPLRNIKREKFPQLYFWNYNRAGRPDGLWLSFGSAWLDATTKFENPKFPPCCYLYAIKIHPNAKILKIKSLNEFYEFDKKYADDYWINMDYLELDYIDYLTNERILSHPKLTFSVNNLVRKKKESIKDMLINNKIIFTNANDARTGSEFYRTTNIDINRFKYKDWSRISGEYDGISFEIFDRDNADMMYYIWFQSLDIKSACVWNFNIIESVKLLYRKDTNMWEYV